MKLGTFFIEFSISRILEGFQTKKKTVDKKKSLSFKKFLFASSLNLSSEKNQFQIWHNFWVTLIKIFSDYFFEKFRQKRVLRKKIMRIFKKQGKKILNPQTKVTEPPPHYFPAIFLFCSIFMHYWDPQENFKNKFFFSKKIILKSFLSLSPPSSQEKPYSSAFSKNEQSQ